MNTGLIENLKARILKSIITLSETRQQAAKLKRSIETHADLQHLQSTSLGQVRGCKNVPAPSPCNPAPPLTSMF